MKLVDLDAVLVEFMKGGPLTSAGENLLNRIKELSVHKPEASGEMKNFKEWFCLFVARLYDRGHIKSGDPMFDVFKKFNRACDSLTDKGESLAVASVEFVPKKDCLGINCRYVHCRSKRCLEFRKNHHDSLHTDKGESLTVKVMREFCEDWENEPCTYDRKYQECKHCLAIEAREYLNKLPDAK